jgi:pimeloyl-ACP methyl ester carboxylesterase
MTASDRSRWLSVNGLDLHVREWGTEGSPKLFLLHGWMDVSASFAFLVEELRRDWHVLAPDWRGFGLSSWASHGYEFPDYFADLDALLDRLSPDEPARVVGHSMGGNVLMAYAGLRPQRLSRVVSLAQGVVQRKNTMPVLSHVLLDVGTDADGIGASPRDLWAPRADHVWVSRSRQRCGGCLQVRFENPSCPLERHACMDGLPPDAVWPLVEQAWQRSGTRNGSPCGTPG